MNGKRINNKIGTGTFKYFAFISYSSVDMRWGKRLQRKMERYRMPATLCSEHQWESNTPMKPVFFAPSDIQPGDLSEELKKRLEESRNLIVICSPSSAKSEWVGKEIAYFNSLGRTGSIHFFIVRGEPHSDDPGKECFNPVIDRSNLPEVLGANIHEKIFLLPWLNRQRAYIQLITKLLGIEFDTLWNRHRRIIIRQTVTFISATAIIISALFAASSAHRPSDVSVELCEMTPANHNLPPLSNASVTLILDNERKDTTAVSLSDTVTFSNIPADKLGKSARILFSCEDFMPIDTTVILRDNISLNISRDPYAFGHIRFTLYDSNAKPVADKRMHIDGIETKSDENGLVELLIPIERQRPVYRITSTDVTLRDTLKDAKCGSGDAIFCSK